MVLRLSFISLFRLNRKISVDISNRNSQNDSFGLLAFRLIAVGHMSGSSRVSVIFGSTKRSFSIDEITRTIEDDRRTLVVHVNTHLFPNGPQTFKLSLHSNNAKQLESEAIEVDVRNVGILAQAVSADLRRHGTPEIFGATVDSAQFPYFDGHAKAWFEEEAPKDVPLNLDIASSSEEAEAHLNRWGFTILPELLPKSIAEGYISELSDAIERGKITGDFTSSNRIHGGHLLSSGRAIWLYKPVLKFLKQHFRDDPCACQTLTYFNGSEQAAHQDTIHLTPYPAGYMCGVWIALEEVKSGSGELFVYPGSHRARRLTGRELGLNKVTTDYSEYTVFDAAVREIIAANGFEKIVYRPKAGQILVWSENLIHGGAPRVNRELTRASIVSHYFARGAVSYYDSRGEASSLVSTPAD